MNAHARIALPMDGEPFSVPEHLTPDERVIWLKAAAMGFRVGFSAGKRFGNPAPIWKRVAVDLRAVRRWLNAHPKTHLAAQAVAASTPLGLLVLALAWSAP